MSNLKKIVIGTVLLAASFAVYAASGCCACC